MPSRHELTDANALKIMWVGVMLIVAGLGMFLGLAGLFFLLKSYAEPKTVSAASPNSIAKHQALPLFEQDAVAAREAKLAKERHLLNSYEWLNREKGIVRIPIEQAIEIVTYEH